MKNESSKSKIPKPHFDITLRGQMDTLGIEPRAFRMRSGCDTATPCARLKRWLVLADPVRSPKNCW